MTQIRNSFFSKVISVFLTYTLLFQIIFCLEEPDEPTLQSGMALENGKFSIIMPLWYNSDHYQWRSHGGMQMQMQMRMSAGLG